MKNREKVQLPFLIFIFFLSSWGYSQTFVPASNGNNSNNAQNGQPSQFPQLQSNPFGSAGMNNSSGSQTVMPTSVGNSGSPAQKGGAQASAPSFPHIAPASSPKTFVPGYHPVVIPLATSGMGGGSGGYGGNRSAGGTGYSSAPTYIPPVRSAPKPSSTTPKPSSVVIPNVPSNAQKVNPTYVQPNSNANSGSMSSSPQTVGSTNLTPQACMATGACK